MDDKREKLMQKIEGLLRLGDADRNTSEEEAAVAMRMARKLMVQHDIAVGDLTLDDESSVLNWEFGHESYEIGRGLTQWNKSLAWAVAEVTGTRWSFCRLGRRRCALTFYGHVDDVEMALRLLPDLIKLIRRRARQEYGDDSSGRNGYSMGFAATLHSRAREEFKAEEVEDTGETVETFALVVQRKKDWVDENMGQFRLKTSSRRGRVSDADAYWRGVDHGRQHAFGVQDEIKG